MYGCDTLVAYPMHPFHPSVQGGFPCCISTEYTIFPSPSSLPCVETHILPAPAVPMMPATPEACSPLGSAAAAQGGT